MCAGYVLDDAELFDVLVGESVVKAERHGYVYRAPVDEEVVEAYGGSGFEQAVRSSIRGALRDRYREEMGAFLARGDTVEGVHAAAAEKSGAAYVERMWNRIRDGLTLDGFRVVYVPEGMELPDEGDWYR